MIRLYVAIFVISGALTAQAQSRQNRDLPSIRGHYKQLQAFNGQPGSPNSAIDSIKFPLDPAAAQKRLSMKPYYLKNATMSDFTLPDPPANSSAQTRAELNYLLALQHQRTSLDVEAALYMAGVFYNTRTKPSDSTYRYYRQNLFFVGRSIGTWFNPDTLPLTAELLAHTWEDASYFIWAFKYRYLRVRPYKLDPAIENLEDTNWAAYPSGHAANSYINAYILQELAPEFSDVFIKDAYDMAHSREIIGVHYPSDSEASRILARQLVNRLFQNRQFVDDFAEVKKEWKEKAKEEFVRPPAISAKNRKAPSCANQSASACARKCN